MPQITPDDLELQRDSIKDHSTRSTTTSRWKCATQGLEDSGLSGYPEQWCSQAAAGSACGYRLTSMPPPGCSAASTP